MLTARRFLTSAAVAIILLVAAAAPPVAATDAPVYHWNIFGGCSTNEYGHAGNCGQPEPIQVLHLYTLGAAIRSPWFITLNEVCDFQVWELIARLQPLGYSVHFVRTNGILNLPAPDPRYSRVSCGNPGSAGGIHGNVILSTGTPTAAGAVDFAAQAAGGDYRSFGWMRVNTFFGGFRPSVSHLDYSPTNDGGSHDPVSTNGQQNTQLRSLFDFAALSGDRVVLGADRNTTRHEPFSAYPEIDTASPKRRTYPNFSPIRKLDWVYASGFSLVPGADTWCPPYSLNPTSDHCLVMGRLSF